MVSKGIEFHTRLFTIYDYFITVSKLRMSARNKIQGDNFIKM